MKTINKIIEYSWCLFIFILPWQTRLFLRPGQINGAYSEYITISLYASDILLLFVLSLQIFKVLREDLSTPEKMNISRTWYFLAALELIIFISIFVARDKWLAVYHYVLFLAGLGIFWLLQSGKMLTNNFYYSFFAAGVIQAFLAIGQFFVQKSFAMKWLGIAAHDPATLGVAVVETSGVRYLRAYGAFDHPNILGAYLAIVLLLFLIWQLKQKVDPQNFIFKKKILYHIIFIIIFVGLFFSFSRAAWLAFGVGMISLWLIAYRQKSDIGKKILCRYSLLIIILFSVFVGVFQDLVLTRMSNDTRLEQKSVNERVSSYREASEMIGNHSTFGVGVGNYVLALRNETYQEAPAWSLQPVHNVPLLIAAELGIVGALLVIVIIINFAWQLFSDKENIYFLPILFSLIIVSLFDHWLVSFHFGILFLWLGLGVVDHETRNM